MIPEYHQTSHILGVEEETGGLSHTEKYSKVVLSHTLITSNTPTGGRVQFIKAHICGGTGNEIHLLCGRIQRAWQSERERQRDGRVLFGVVMH